MFSPKQTNRQTDSHGVKESGTEFLFEKEMFSQAKFNVMEARERERKWKNMGKLTTMLLFAVITFCGSLKVAVVVEAQRDNNIQRKTLPSNFRCRHHQQR